ncbi:MAG: hemerythrin domain-containing protein [Ilumatobacteraceae bacterium]
MLMCDYCGCRRSGPTAELAAEHERLVELGDILHTALYNGLQEEAEATTVFNTFVRLLQMHAAKEEVGLFVQAKESTPLGDRIDALCREHDDLHRWLADGLAGPHVPDALRLLVTHIDDEEYDLFPHVFHALDPEQWDEIELAHRAVEAVWNEPLPGAASHDHDHPYDHPHDHDHPHDEDTHEHH